MFAPRLDVYRVTIASNTLPINFQLKYSFTAANWLAVHTQSVLDLSLVNSSTVTSSIAVRWKFWLSTNWFGTWYLLHQYTLYTVFIINRRQTLPTVVYQWRRRSNIQRTPFLWFVLHTYLNFTLPFYFTFFSKFFIC